MLSSRQGRTNPTLEIPYSYYSTSITIIIIIIINYYYYYHLHHHCTLCNIFLFNITLDAILTKNCLNESRSSQFINFVRQVYIADDLMSFNMFFSIYDRAHCQ